MSSVTLTGLDGANPLAFLAALGLLRLCSERADGAVTLSWSDEGRWLPTLSTAQEVGELEDCVLADHRTWGSAPELELAYEKKDKKKGVKIVRDLKPPRDIFRKFLSDAVASSTPGSRRHVDFGAAYATDIARDGNGNTKPTALHFTAGQQLFLERGVIPLRDGLRREHITEALFGPWTYKSSLPSLRWDVRGDRNYALLASDPSRNKPPSIPGAEWLAFQALPLFPCVPRGARVVTTGFVGSGKNYTFRWMLWTVPATLPTVRSLLATPAPNMLSASQRIARGIGLVLQSQVHRTDQGGYGSFRPPAVV